MVEPVQHLVGFGIPNDAALAALAECAPLVEVGAGTGYWSAVLRQRGVDILAFDVAPPDASCRNGFFQSTFGEVLQGSAPEMFSAASGQLGRRALLIVWPNNPDGFDNVHLHSSFVGPAPWDAGCLEAFMAAGGSTVAFVGEREAALSLDEGALPDCGESASRRFQELLLENFTLHFQIPLPHWHRQLDDMTIWMRSATQRT